jgi:hypothetical protein
MLHGGKFIFIRFNPDQFTNSLGTKKNPYMKRRMEYLEKEIYNHITRINDEKNKDLLEISLNTLARMLYAYARPKQNNCTNQLSTKM